MSYYLRMKSMITFNGKTVGLVIALIVAIVGLGNADTGDFTPEGKLNNEVTSVDALRVQELWDEHCNSCHGKDGRGKTRTGRKERVKDLTDLEYQDSFSDKDMFLHIRDGMEEEGKERMKAYGDKMTEDEIKAFIPYVRKFRGTNSE